MSFAEAFCNPPREFSLLPFWFWNDELDRDEILRQIDSFERNGVYGFVIHPRVGLPRELGWMSEKLLGFYRIAIEEAARREMKVLLYDEGMYPSGSSCGQVVQRYPELACRCLALHNPAFPMPAKARVVATIIDDVGRLMLVVDRPADSYIRGLHYIGDGPAEDEPPAGDILNPRTADAIIELVYNRCLQAFGEHFGKTILGIFTDEPNALGRCREKNVLPGTSGILDHVSRLLGYDFSPHLAALWSNQPEAEMYRKDYRRAIGLRLEETWYAPLSKWCADHGVALCGHPDAGDEIGVQRRFQIPGQDLVWRWVLPDHKNALEGPESTQGKCSSSAMIHAGRRRNSNEFAGAYGPETTFDEICWLANWCLIRGVNLLIPHAFYYSIRGPRRDERPPQVGPHTPQWADDGKGDFKAFADHCRRMSWLNTDSRHLCHVAVLTDDDRCPWPAAAAILRGARDFNYLDPHTLLQTAAIDATGVRVGPMHYELIVIDGERPLSENVRIALRPAIRAGAVVRYSDQMREDGIRHHASGRELVAAIDAVRQPLVALSCSTDALRIRFVEKQGITVLQLFNESGSIPADIVVAGSTLQPIGHRREESESVELHAIERLTLAPCQLVAFCVRQ